LPPGLVLDALGKGRQVGAETVKKALRRKAEAFVLEGYSPNHH
jgi:hypothetical protein